MSKSPEEISILIIYTGGTIGMVEDAQTGALSPVDFSQIQARVPELNRLGHRITTLAFNPPIDSSDITIEVWGKIAQIIQDNYYQHDGFVVLHGSDTMAFSASALSFMLENLSKPVIFTGSQLPIGKTRTDGKENIITAVEIAAAKQDGHAIISEVCIYFENKLYRGNRTTKFNAQHFNAFRSENYPALAAAGVHIKYNQTAIHPYPSTHLSVFKIHTTMNPNVAILKLFPGITANYVKAVFSTEGLRAVVMETFGSGNAPTEAWFLEAIADACARKIIIVNITQCTSGSVEMGRYATSLNLKAAGVISGYDMTTEAAITKLMFLLGQDLSHEKIVNYLHQSICGEMTLDYQH